MVPWTIAALAGGASVALGGLLVAVAVGAIAWLGSDFLDFGTAAESGVKFWLAANGASITLGQVQVSAIPLGFTVLLMVLATGAAGFAGRQARNRLASLAQEDTQAFDSLLEGDAEASEQPTARPDELDRQRHRSVLIQLVGLFVAGYLLVVLIAGASTLPGDQVMIALVGGGLLAGISALWGAGRPLNWHPTAAWPTWLRAVPLAIVAALLALLASGAVVLGVSFAQHWRRVASLHDALAPGTAGSWVLLFVQLAYLLNLVLWCASWALGGGVSLGDGSLLTPATTHTGLLPALPIFGAVPSNGPGGGWLLAWLLSGVAAGVLAAVIVTYSRRRARFDETALAGGLAGVASALVLVLCCALANGGLGTTRLAHLGARLGPLTIIGGSLLGLSGLIAGLILGLIRGYDKTVPAAPQPEPAPGQEHGLEESEDGTEMSFR